MVADSAPASDESGNVNNVLAVKLEESRVIQDQSTQEVREAPVRAPSPEEASRSEEITAEPPTKDDAIPMEASYDHIPEFAPPPYSAEEGTPAVAATPQTSIPPAASTGRDKQTAEHEGVKGLPESTEKNQSWFAQIWSGK